MPLANDVAHREHRNPNYADNLNSPNANNKQYPPLPPPLHPSLLPRPLHRPPQASLPRPHFSSHNLPPTAPRLLPPTATQHVLVPKTLSLPPKSRGSYLVTSDIEKQLPELKNYKTGLLNLFLQHTSAALSLNENWDSEVREDMTDALERIVPYDKAGKLYRHAAEGEDDMPAHIKSALIGASVTIPITDGRLATGTWQGIWYLEFRTARHSRKVVATIQGEKM